MACTRYLAVGLACLTIALASTVREADLSADRDVHDEFSGMVDGVFSEKPECDAEVSKVESKCNTERETLQKAVSSACGDADLRKLTLKIQKNQKLLAQSRKDLKAAEAVLVKLKLEAAQAEHKKDVSEHGLLKEMTSVYKQEAKLKVDQKTHDSEKLSDKELLSKAEAATADASKKAATTDDIVAIKALRDSAADLYHRYVLKRIAAARTIFKESQTKDGVSKQGDVVAKKKAELQTALDEQKIADGKLHAEQKKVASMTANIAATYVQTATLENQASVRENEMLGQKAADAKSTMNKDMKQLDENKKKEDKAEKDAKKAEETVESTKNMSLKALLKTENVNA
jgi:hypothetical protein